MLLAVAADRGWSAQADRAGLLALGGLVSGHAGIAGAVTRLGDPLVRIGITAALAVVLLLARRLRDALFLAGTVASGSLLVTLIKLDVGRPRPALLPHLAAVHNASFPSGHAANSALVYGAIAVVLRETRAGRPLAILAVLIALLVGLSRIGLAVHWPSDVLGGWALGAGWLCLAHAVSLRLGRHA